MRLLEPFTAKRMGFLLGTWVYGQARHDDPTAARGALDAAFDEIKRLEGALSRFRGESEVAALNRSEGVPVRAGRELFGLLQKSAALARRSGRALDVTVAPLVDLWREAERRGSVPADAEITACLARVGSGALDLFFTVFGGIFSGVILVVVSFYLASQEKGIEHFLRLVTPLRDENYVIDLWMRTHAKLGRWLRGQLLLGLAIGIVVYLVLSVLGIKYALSLALIAAIFELIPIIGPILAAVPAVFLGFLKGPELGLTVAVAYFLIQQLESHLLVPVVMRQAVGLNPLLIIIALLAGAKLGGVMGMFLAVPVASVLVEFLTDTDRRRRLFMKSGESGH